MVSVNPASAWSPLLHGLARQAVEPEVDTSSTRQHIGDGQVASQQPQACAAHGPAERLAAGAPAGAHRAYELHAEGGYHRSVPAGPLGAERSSSPPAIDAS